QTEQQPPEFRNQPNESVSCDRTKQQASVSSKSVVGDISPKVLSVIDQRNNGERTGDNFNGVSHDQFERMQSDLIKSFQTEMSKVQRELESVKQTVENLNTDRVNRERQGVPNPVSDQIKGSSVTLLSAEENVVPSLNVYTVSPHLLPTHVEPWLPGEAMPIQCVDVPNIKVTIEGRIIKCIADTGAGPAIVVSENLGREILGRKYGTQEQVNAAIIPTEETRVANCAGEDVKIAGQAIVNMKYGKLACAVPMLLLKGESKSMEPLIGMYLMKQMGMRLITPDKKDLLGNTTMVELEHLHTIEEPVQLPNMKHTQIRVLKQYFVGETDVPDKAPSQTNIPSQIVPLNAEEGSVKKMMIGYEDEQRQRQQQSPYRREVTTGEPVETRGEQDVQRVEHGPGIEPVWYHDCDWGPNNTDW
ncbi:MAG: hypothetical protein GY820_42415, partial [Gammaproteobacteria bacterium]|nr:hypothetical protein [Gammaproteobacteria bacterium]